ncbi:hypothetical protein WN48_03697 [Eufriesea mexicana]|nr:hypothetical protein WN48_03697 [Eufriesea mexicana]
MSCDRQFRPMGLPRMAKLAAIAIVLAACTVQRSSGIDPRGSIERRAATAGMADEAIGEIFRVISTEKSSKKDDDLLVKYIKEEIMRTAQSIKTPSGSIEAAARRAQKLVTELTAAYTTAIYKSKSTEEAKVNFGRFQNTVQSIVDFIKNGQVPLCYRGGFKDHGTMTGVLSVCSRFAMEIVVVFVNPFSKDSGFESMDLIGCNRILSEEYQELVYKRALRVEEHGAIFGRREEKNRMMLFVQGPRTHHLTILLDMAYCHKTNLKLANNFQGRFCNQQRLPTAQPDFPRNPRSCWFSTAPRTAQRSGAASRRGQLEVTTESAASYVDFIWETDSTTNQRII